MSKIFRTFKEACDFYKYPGSHQIGSFGNANGIIRSYSNGTPGKDFVMEDETVVLYKLKDEMYRAKFSRNMSSGQKVRIFRRVTSEGIDDKDKNGIGRSELQSGRRSCKAKESIVKDLGLFSVVGFEDGSGHVKMVSVSKYGGSRERKRRIHRTELAATIKLKKSKRS